MATAMHTSTRVFRAGTKGFSVKTTPQPPLSPVTKPALEEVSTATTPLRVFLEGAPHVKPSPLSAQGVSSPLDVHPSICISPDPWGSCLCWDRHLCHRLYFFPCFRTWVQLLGPRLMEDPDPIWPPYIQRRSWGCSLLTRCFKPQSLKWMDFRCD